MRFESNKDALEFLRLGLRDGRDSVLEEALVELHPADLAEIIDDLKTDESAYLLKLLDKEARADVLIELEEDVREKILASFTSKEIAEVLIESIDSDDAADVINELSEERKEEVISHIEDEELASDIKDLLTYQEGTAGAMMAKELVRVNQDWSVATCIREMRKQASDIDNVYTIYIVDDSGVLTGILSLKNMLFATNSTRTPIRDIIKKRNLITATPNEELEDVAVKMKKYDLVAIPVVDNSGVLMGRITIDDMVDYIQEEADKDYQMASGLSEIVEADDRPWVLMRARLPWLLIGLMGGIVSATVIREYEGQISIYPEMAFFMTMIAAMGGNAGVQTSAIVVQGLANQTIEHGDTIRRLLKELGLALMNGLILGGIMLCYNLLVNESLALTYTVSTALFCVIIFASLFGTVTPLVLEKFNIDPALATGPFITTANDIAGLFIYFMVGRILYRYFELRPETAEQISQLLGVG
jgi:magnesium transporter